MTVVILYEKDSNEISTIVKQLKDKGYKINIDFDFEYSTGKYDWINLENIPKQTKFIFYNEPLGTWFALMFK